MARATRAMATARKSAMETAARAMITALTETATKKGNGNGDWGGG
jgi:hypothetical protein